MQKHIGDHESEQIIHKSDRFEKANTHGIMAGIGVKKVNHKILKAPSHFLLERDRCATQIDEIMQNPNTSQT